MAGGPSVPSWLAARAGYVLATDVDVSWMTDDLTTSPLVSAWGRKPVTVSR